MKASQILATKDYGLFENNPHQRTFTMRKVKSLMEKMRENGFPPSMAISVYRHGGKLIINAGHHRLAAAKELGIPVFYVTEHKWTHKELSDEGDINTSWSLRDHISNYAKEGKEDYMELLRLQEMGLSATLAASMMRGESAGSGNANVKTGAFKIKCRHQTFKWVAMWNEFGQRVPSLCHRSFVTAWSKCMLTPEFDQEVFLKRLRANPDMLDRCSTEDQALNQIEDVYNYKTPRKIPLAFIVKENSRSRKLCFGKTERAA
jgi:hypothetical protein